MKTLLSLFISILALVITDRLFGSVYFDRFTTVMWFALVLYLLDKFVKPVLILLTLPVTIVTLGIFLIVINAIILLLAAKLVKGIHIPGFWTAVGFSMVYSLIKLILEKIFLKTY